MNYGRFVISSFDVYIKIPIVLQNQFVEIRSSNIKKIK